MTPLRPLRPRPLTAAGITAGNLDPEAGRISIRRPARQRKTNSACDPCRKRKTKCDGRLPRCLMCEHRAEACEYTYTIRHRVTVTDGEESKHHGSTEMLESLRTLPHEQALELFRKLRNEPAGPLLSLSRPSDHQTLRALLPPTQNSLGFELTMRHPVAYPTLFPVSYTELSLGSLLKPMRMPRPGEGQNVLAWQDLQSKDPYLTPEQDNDDDSKRKQATPDAGDPDVPGVLFDERLRLLDITQWTPIPIPNSLAIGAISHYLEIDYAIIPLFDAELFIQDLVSSQHFFCSPFLVTAVLCWACQAYSPLHPDAAAFSVSLFAQAQRDFSEQAQPNSLTTIAALQILSMCAVTYGKDDMSLQFLQDGAKLGRLMGLFDVRSEAESARTWLADHERWTRAASYTAWGVFNWISVYSLHYHIFEIETPPLLPKPRDLVVEPQPGENDENDGLPQAVMHAQVLSASSDMWVIFKEVLQQFYGPQSVDLSQQTSVEFAEETYHKLLTWASLLPLEMARGEESGHDIMMMHVYFHAVVTDLFRPFLASSLRDQRLHSFSTNFATPEAVYAASVTQLKRLLLLYRLRYKRACFSVLWQTAVVYVANAMIREAGVSAPQPDVQPGVQSGAEWQFYLDLCLAGLEDLYVSFPVFGSVAQGVVGMALRHAAIRTGKAARLLKRLSEIEKQHVTRRGINEKAEARWIINFDLAMTDPEAAQGRNLARDFMGLKVNKPAGKKPRHGPAPGDERSGDGDKSVSALAHLQAG